MEVLVILDKDVMPLTRVRVTIELDIGLGLLSKWVIFIFVVLFFRLYIVINILIDTTINYLASR